ncbi:MAG: D-alanyl-D-alanine carboxypeptidase family protein [Alphaproteobacteria bacterium]
MLKKYLLLPLAVMVAMVFIFNVEAARNVYGNKYASIIIDVKDGKILYSRGANLQRYPASLTKIMTLYILFEELKKGKIKLNTKFTASKRAVRQPPSRIGLGIGEKITVKNAILALVVKSANDVAVTVAENLGGTERKFAKRMTATAKRIGMKKTTFRNASGLPNYAQVTTAYDMSILGTRLFKDFPEYYKYISTRTFKYAGVTFRNHNKLLTRYKGTDGIKTGYIRASGFNLVSSVERDGVRLIGVVFGGVSGSRRDLHMRYLLDKGFRVAEHMASRPVDKTETATYAKLNNIKLPIKTAKVDLKKKEEQGSKQPLDTGWAIQVGAYSNKKFAKTATKKVLAILPDKNDLTVEILEIKKNKRSLFRARVEGFDKKYAKKVCSAVKVETDMPCIVLKD